MLLEWWRVVIFFFFKPLGLVSSAGCTDGGWKHLSALVLL